MMAKTYAQFVTEATTGDGGLYSFRKPCLHSAEILSEWIQENRIPNPISNQDLHVTVVHSETDIPNYVPDNKPVWVNPATYSIGFLGDALVLKFQNAVLTKQWEQANNLGAKSKWPSYQPHVSLSYSVPEGFDYSHVKPLPVQMVLDQEQMRP